MLGRRGREVRLDTWGTIASGDGDVAVSAKAMTPTSRRCTPTGTRDRRCDRRNRAVSVVKLVSADGMKKSSGLPYRRRTINGDLAGSRRHTHAPDDRETASQESEERHEPMT